jgi:hypothetical protein
LDRPLSIASGVTGQLRTASTPAPWPYMKYPKNVKAFIELATEGGEAVLLFVRVNFNFTDASYLLYMCRFQIIKDVWI